MPIRRKIAAAVLVFGAAGSVTAGTAVATVAPAVVASAPHAHPNMLYQG